MTFNEEYIEQFVFKQEELLENSFEIFIKDEKYIENLVAVEVLFSNVKTIVDENESLSKIDRSVVGITGLHPKQLCHLKIDH